MLVNKGEKEEIQSYFFYSNMAKKKTVITKLIVHEIHFNMIFRTNKGNLIILDYNMLMTMNKTNGK